MVSLRSLVASAALMAAPVLAALTPQQITDGIKLMAQKTYALHKPAQSITTANPLVIIGGGPFPTIIAGFIDIASTGRGLIAQFPNTDPIQKRNVPSRITRRGPDADLVFESFREFVGVAQELFNILIDKAGLLTNIPGIGQPVAAALREVEGVIDTIGITLINLIESRATDLTADTKSLSATLKLCIEKYSSLA
ncbi:hypothetical protein C7999DRAFT_15014 [Corynascus novoguineensis]|uniref:Uncharacterized protein n=1 Tax=Corynascus novoguineensis TaxID=1126955 RepID=A0AAN7CRB9_9PEZI|nr:hypothetical protein C7999DRAFT_15014 [Corynascus novoguineensis]